MNNMKRFPLYTASVALLLFCACSNDVLPGDDGDNTPLAALRIEVSASDFTNDNGTNTRATDNSAATTFESGDRIGIIVLDNSNHVLSDNIPYIYNGDTWSFDNSNGEGKTAVYYDNKAGTLTYLAYFPYSVEANGVTSLDNLKVKFPPQPDQRTKDAYRASDLLVWSSETGSAPLKKLNIEFTHAYSSLSLPSIDITCEITGVEGTTTYSSSSIGDVNFTINGNPYFAYKASDGSYRFITVLPSLTANDCYFFTYGTKTYSSTMSAISFAANTRYTLVPSLNLGQYSLNNAKIGDFYCRNNSNEGYLIPGEIASLTVEQKAACLGIVLKVGKDDSGDWKDDCDYKLKDSQTSMSDIHGYVLALNDANGGNYCQWGSYGTKVEHVDMNRDQYTGFYGYKNTQAIKGKVAADKTLADAFPATYYTTAAYEDSYASPVNSSGWFLPSAGQCWYWFKNEGVLLSSMKKASGNENYSWKSYYWSSSEGDYNPASNAWYLGFYCSGVDYYDKGYDYCVRACLAF